MLPPPLTSLHRHLRTALLAGVAVTLVVLAACSDSSKPDGTPPATTSDLLVSAATETTATLAWTAPGDDGSRGTATAYDLRMTTGPAPASWDTAAVASETLPEPLEAGAPQTHAVGGLTTDTTYRFALRASDENENWSGFSNVAEVQTGDPEPPGRVTDLQATLLEPRAVTLEWTAPGDDGEVGTATEYALRRASDPITEATWDAATSIEVPFTPQPVGETETLRVTGLQVDGSYHFAVRARDDGGHWSEVSNDLALTLPEDTVPPGAITDLRVTDMGLFTATLQWTAPGNDGAEARASGYLVRYATESLATEEAWSGATEIPVNLSPAEPGEAESLGLTDLPGGATVWFAVRAVDEAGNIGGLSNEASGYVWPDPATWEVRVDGSGDAPTIQAAIDSSRSGDVVDVYPGTYFENVVIHAKDIHLRSVEGPEATIIDGTGKNASVVVISGGSTREMILEGFTITGGTGTVSESGAVTSGGGVRLLESSASVVGNVIKENSVGVLTPIGYGGGMSIVGAGAWPNLPSPLVKQNSFQRNESRINGGALSVSSSFAEVVDNLFLENRARYDGGAVYASMSFRGALACSGNRFVGNVAGDHGGAIEAGEATQGVEPLEIENCLFLRNEAHGADPPFENGTGGALSIRGWPANIVNNTFVDNIGTGKAQCTGGSLLITAGERPVIVERNIFAGSDGCAVVCRWPQNAAGAILRDNLFWENVPGDIGNEAGCFEGRVLGSLFSDPLFCDPTNDDYRLQSGSPALTNPGGVIGAFSEPGCGPRASSTWTSLRRLYR